MLELHYTNQMKRDLRLVKKRGKDLRKLKIITDLLQEEQVLVEKYRNHKLSRDYKDHWECHIEPDWLLIYLLSSKTVTLVRTGNSRRSFLISTKRTLQRNGEIRRSKASGLSEQKFWGAFLSNSRTFNWNEYIEAPAANF